MKEATALAPGATRASETDAGNYTLELTNGRHRWTADEPESVGGRDAGPNPYELLASSLASCVAITVRMYADRKGWPMTSISVDVTHGRIHAEDCAECDTQKGMIDRLDKIVRIEGELDDEQLDRLMDIADRCPVQRSLKGEMQIVTRRG